MGASDRSGMHRWNGVPQEIVAACYEIADESVEKMLQFLFTQGFEKDRVKARFNTWKGVYFTVPDDELPWDIEEYEKLRDTLSKHPNVRVIDTSMGSGSEG